MSSIQIKDLSLVFPHKICFDSFDSQILYGSRIAIIGRNGGGKSTLLNALQGNFLPTLQGKITLPDGLRIGFVPQVIENLETLSGGQRFNALLSTALAEQPDLLLLDEPTNHLDEHNRRSLMRMLKYYTGTLIIVSHDETLLRSTVDTFWHIEGGKIEVFTGGYDDYQAEIHQRRSGLETELNRLSREKKQTHQSLMQEQERAAKSRKKGEKSLEQKKWPTIVSRAKMHRAQETTGKKKVAIEQEKTQLSEQLASLRQPEVILPKFSLGATSLGSRALLTVSDGRICYGEQFILEKIYCSLTSGERVALLGENGSGKTTFLRGLLKIAEYPQIQKIQSQCENLIIVGEWIVPKQAKMAYLDQHYRNLNNNDTVLETIQTLVPNWSFQEVRQHLNDFLFRKNEEVEIQVAHLSGGEKARLSLAQIAALTPELLILDELTNNLDLVTKEHVIQVLNEYPGALLVISHDQNFLRAIGVSNGFQIRNQTLSPVVI